MKVWNGNVDKTVGCNTSTTTKNLVVKSVTKRVNCEHNRKHQELET